MLCGEERCIRGNDIISNSNAIVWNSTIHKRSLINKLIISFHFEYNEKLFFSCYSKQIELNRRIGREWRDVLRCESDEAKKVLKVSVRMLMCLEASYGRLESGERMDYICCSDWMLLLLLPRLLLLLIHSVASYHILWFREMI